VPPEWSFRLEVARRRTNAHTYFFLIDNDRQPGAVFACTLTSILSRRRERGVRENSRGDSCPPLHRIRGEGDLSNGWTSLLIKYFFVLTYRDIVIKLT
jgi:hypothetical protein